MANKIETELAGVAVGGLVLARDNITFNDGYLETCLLVRNTGDRPIQIGSHFHFFEANHYLEFDRAKSFGKRLNIPATTALRFEPGDERKVSLVSFQGKLRIVGFNGLVEGWGACPPEHSYNPRFIDALDMINKYQFSNKS